jgi:hypothetical protein
MDFVTLLIAILSVLGAIVLKLMIAEIQDWLPALTKRTIERAAQRLPQELRPRYSEEWFADINEFPGNVSKLVRAIGCYRCANQLLRSYRLATPTRYSVGVTHRESEIRFFIYDRFEIAIDLNIIDITIVDRRPTDGAEARDILFFALDRLDELRSKGLQDRDIEWNKLAEAIVDRVCGDSL